MRNGHYGVIFGIKIKLSFLSFKLSKQWDGLKLAQLASRGIILVEQATGMINDS